jgi:hypothetical protein
MDGDHSYDYWCLTPLSTIFQIYRGRQFLLVEETGVPGENHRPVASHWQYYIEYTSAWTGFELTTLLVISTDWLGSNKSNYHMITIATAPCSYGQSFSCIIFKKMFNFEKKDFWAENVFQFAHLVKSYVHEVRYIYNVPAKIVRPFRICLPQ